MTTPWPLLSEVLAGSRRSALRNVDLEAQKLSADELVAAGLLERESIERTWCPSECTESCMPGFDFEKRSDEGLFGAWCPCEVGCTDGVEWHRVRDVETFTCPPKRMGEALRGLNRLHVLDSRGVDREFTPVGVSTKRGRTVPVMMLAGRVHPLEDACRGVRARLGGDGLIVLMGHPPTRTSFDEGERIVLWPLRADASGDLGLAGALDRIDPTWRAKRMTDRNAIFDDVRIGFATEPGKRHVVTIDGHELTGFQESDLKFVRLLRLAVERRENATSEGWLGKAALHVDAKDHQIEGLRDELRKGEHPTLTPDERAALIKSAGVDGRVRLAVDGANVGIDASLGSFRLLKEEVATVKGSRATVRASDAALNLGVATARKVWGAIAPLAR